MTYWSFSQQGWQLNSKHCQITLCPTVGLLTLWPEKKKKQREDRNFVKELKEHIAVFINLFTILGHKRTKQITLYK